MNYQTDFIIVISTIIVIAINTTLLTYKRKKLKRYRDAFIFIAAGMLILLISPIDCLFDGSCDADYFVSTLLLKKVTGNLADRYFCAVGYVSFFFGLTMAILTKLNRCINKSS